jgi:NADH-quinone oxidoreductase subunit L
VPEHAGEFHPNNPIFWVSAIALLIGAGAAFVLYNGKDKDPLSIPLLRNRFYIDTLYDKYLVRYFQDAFAAIVHFFDELLINGLLVGGLSRTAASFGNVFRRVQSGSLQAYAYVFGLGVVLVIYFTVFL